MKMFDFYFSELAKQKQKKTKTKIKKEITMKKICISLHIKANFETELRNVHNGLIEYKMKKKRGKKNILLLYTKA